MKIINNNNNNKKQLRGFAQESLIVSCPVREPKTSGAELKISTRAIPLTKW